MPLKFKNIPKSPHKTIWYHLMNFFCATYSFCRNSDFWGALRKRPIDCRKKWHSLKFFHHIDLCTLHYFHSFCNKTPWLLRKESAFSKKLPLNFPLHNSVTPTEKIRVFQKKLQKTLTLWPIFGPKIGLLVWFLDHMMQNFKYNYKVTTSTFTKSAQKSVSLTERLMVSCSIYVRGELGGLATRAGQRSLLEMLPMHSL